MTYQTRKILRRSPSTPTTLTKRQRRAAYKHAKDHVREALHEALVDLLTDEHHSIMTVAQVDAAKGRAFYDVDLSNTVHDEVMRHIERLADMATDAVRKDSFRRGDLHLHAGVKAGR